MARKALVETQAGSYTDNGAAASNNGRVNDNFVELFKHVEVLDLVANNTSRRRFALPGDRTISQIRARRVTALASAGGNITLAIKDEDGTTLLVAATFDAKTLTASLVALSLTATTALLAIVAGKNVTIELVSDNADATGGPVILEFTFAAAS